MKAPKMGYVDLMDTAINEEQQSKTGKEYSTIRPSQAGGCETALAFDHLAYTDQLPYTKDPMKPNIVRLLNLGHSVEFSMIKDLWRLKEFDIKIKYKQQVVTCGHIFDHHTGEPKIVEGSVDFALVSEKHGFKTLCDAKSAKDAFSRAWKTKWDEDFEKFCNFESTEKLSETCIVIKELAPFLKELGSDFKLNNYLQLNYYACSDFFKSRGFDNCSLLYYNKNDSRIYEMRFTPSQEVADMVTAKFQKAIMSKDPLKDCERTYKLGSIRCAFCKHSDKCWSDDALQAFFDNLPNKRWPMDISRVNGSEALSALFTRFRDHDIKAKEKIEEEICSIMFDQKIKKIKLEDKKVYEMKALKKGLVLRESKI